MVEVEGESEVSEHQCDLERAEESIATAEEACNSMVGNHSSAQQVEAYKKQLRKKLTELENAEKRYKNARDHFERVYSSCCYSNKLTERNCWQKFKYPFIHHYESYVKNIKKRYNQNPSLIGSGELLKAEKAYDKLIYLELDIEVDGRMSKIAFLAFLVSIAALVGSFCYIIHVQPGNKTSPTVKDYFLALAALFAAVVSVLRWTESRRAEALEQHTEVEQKLIKSSEYRHRVNLVISIMEAVSILLVAEVALLGIQH